MMGSANEPPPAAETQNHNHQSKQVGGCKSRKHLATCVHGKERGGADLLLSRTHIFEVVDGVIATKGCNEQINVTVTWNALGRTNA